MSTTYSIVCLQCRVELWIGQGTYIYTAEPETMQSLQEFLFAHKGHPLIFENDSATDDIVEGDLVPEWYKGTK